MISSSFEPITIIADNYRNKGNIWVRSKGNVLPAHVLWILFREKINDVWGSVMGEEMWGEQNRFRCSNWGAETLVKVIVQTGSWILVLLASPASESQPLLTVNPTIEFTPAVACSKAAPPQTSYLTLCSCTLAPGANAVYSIKLMCICLLCGGQPDFLTYWSENSSGTQRWGPCQFLPDCLVRLQALSVFGWAPCRSCS